MNLTSLPPNKKVNCNFYLTILNFFSSQLWVRILHISTRITFHVHAFFLNCEILIIILRCKLRIVKYKCAMASLELAIAYLSSNSDFIFQNYRLYSLSRNSEKKNPDLWESEKQQNVHLAGVFLLHQFTVWRAPMTVFKQFSKNTPLTAIGWENR